MEKCANMKLVACDGFQVEYEVEPTFINEIDSKIDECQTKLDELNKKIDKYTNHADRLDYEIAVASGIICGLIDSFFGDKFSFENVKHQGQEKIDQFVIKVAQKKGYKGNDLTGAVSFLEKKYNIVEDKATNIFGGGKQHHLRDFSHHPTPVGLFFSLLTQFTERVYGTDTSGKFIAISISELKDCENAKKLIGKNTPEKFMFGVVNWFFHMVSDVAGSSTSIRDGKYGTGLPGPVCSLLKEVSSLPFFNSTKSNGCNELSIWVSKLFNGTLLGSKDENGKLNPVEFDLRSEMGVLMQLGKQAIPVLINECIVRGFYFLRRLFLEIRDKKVIGIEDLGKIEWEKTLPLKNRTIVRMMTIASGTFTAVDIADAAIRSGGFNPDMILHVNFVGLGRFAIAVGTDISMGKKRNDLVNERIAVMSQQISYINAKVYYMHAENWIEAKNTAETLKRVIESSNESVIFFSETIARIDNNLNEIKGAVDKISDSDPDFLDDCLDILK